MSAHLTLVVDNGRPAASSAARCAEPPPTDTGSAGRAGSEDGWSGADWVPAPPKGMRGSTLLARVRARVPAGADRGAVTAEYAIVIMAAVAFAGLLVAIMRSGEIRAMLVDLVQNALGMGG